MADTYARCLVGHDKFVQYKAAYRAVLRKDGGRDIVRTLTKWCPNCTPELNDPASYGRKKATAAERAAANK